MPISIKIMKVKLNILNILVVIVPCFSSVCCNFLKGARYLDSQIKVIEFLACF